METLNVRLTSAQSLSPNATTAELLNLAANAFESDYSIPVKITRSQPGAEERGDLTTGIELVNLALTSITTIVAVLTYIKSLEPKCSFLIRSGDRTVRYDRKAPSQELEARLKSWLENAKPEQREMTVEIEI